MMWGACSDGRGWGGNHHKGWMFFGLLFIAGMFVFGWGRGFAFWFVLPFIFAFVVPYFARQWRDGEWGGSDKRKHDDGPWQDGNHKAKREEPRVYDYQTITTPDGESLEIIEERPTRKPDPDEYV